MTQWGGGAPRSPSASAPNSPVIGEPVRGKADASALPAQVVDEVENGTPSASPNLGRRAASRPTSMSMPPGQIDMSQETPPELQPVFSYLNSHSNKLYQEGYFLKLHDLDSRRAACSPSGAH